jgi:superoxide dismutase
MKENIKLSVARMRLNTLQENIEKVIEEEQVKLLYSNRKGRSYVKNVRNRINRNKVKRRIRQSTTGVK